MEGLFGWIQQLWEFLVSWVPHLMLMRRTERGVKYRGGGRVKVIGPGRFWYLPALTDVETMVVTRTTSNLQTLVLTTADGQAVAVSPVIVYHISDVEKAIVETNDLDDAIGDVGMKAVAQEISSLQMEEVLTRNASGDLEHELSKKTRANLRSFGVAVESVFLSEITRKFIRVIGDGAVITPTEEE